MFASGVKLGWRDGLAAFLFLLCAGSVTRVAVDYQNAIAEIAALNGGSAGFIQFPARDFFVLALAIVVGGLFLVLRRRKLGTAICVGAALLAQLAWFSFVRW